MEISLYGGTGFVGSRFRSRFYELYNSTADNIHKIARWNRRPIPNTEILYMISTTNNYNVFDDATMDVDTNLRVFTETLDSWRHNNPNAIFNFVSSWFVYGNEYPAPGYENMKNTFNEIYGDNYYTKNGGALETDECHPRGFYSITKCCAEQLLISYADTFNLKYRIFRLANVVGKSDKGVSVKKNALQYLINEMAAGNEIFLYENGQFYRNYIHIDDCCDAMRLLMHIGKYNAIFNIGNENLLFRDIIYNAAAKLNYDVSKIKPIEQKDFHKKVQAKSFIMDTDKLLSYGFEPQYNMDKMVDTLIY
jgi:nucleoside-diphosphate-sugar epimerase